MRFRFHGDSSGVELHPGDYVLYTKVDGSRNYGIYLSHEIRSEKITTSVVLNILTGKGVEIIRTNMIFSCEVVSKGNENETG